MTKKLTMLQAAEMLYLSWALCQSTPEPQWSKVPAEQRVYWITKAGNLAAKLEV